MGKEITMESVTRLQLVSRITYYLGWLATALGALSHFGLGSRLVAVQKANCLVLPRLFAGAAQQPSLNLLFEWGRTDDAVLW